MATASDRRKAEKTAVESSRHHDSFDFNMTGSHLVRIGTLGQIGRFHAADATQYPRDCPVVLRTERGLETGQVLAWADDSAEADGTILRRMTVEDELLAARLEKNKHQAIEACSRRLKEIGVDATLLDVDPLFDGRRIYFYFLGAVPEEIAEVTDELAEVFEAKVQFRKFTETLTEGCGPDCGTEDAAGSGCVTCVTCAVASACGSKGGDHS